MPIPRNTLEMQSQRRGSPSPQGASRPTFMPRQKRATYIDYPQYMRWEWSGRWVINNQQVLQKAQEKTLVGDNQQYTATDPLPSGLMGCRHRPGAEPEHQGTDFQKTASRGLWLFKPNQGTWASACKDRSLIRRSDFWHMLSSKAQSMMLVRRKPISSTFM